MTEHATTLGAIYEAFGRGDVGAILDRLTDDVQWEVGIRDTGLDHLRDRHGKQQVAEFFPALAANLDLTHFEPLGMCIDGDLAAVPVRHAGRIVGGGDVPMTTEVHLWQFAPDGRVCEFHHVFDYSVHEHAASSRSSHLAGRTLRVLAETMRVEAAGGQLEVVRIEGAAESGPPPHSHPWDECFIGVDGEVEVTVGESVSVLRAGDVIRAAGGELHCYRVVSESAVFRVVTSGHRATAFYADLDANAPAGAPTSESLPAITQIARRNGLASPLFA